MKRGCLILKCHATYYTTHMWLVQKKYLMGSTKEMQCEKQKDYWLILSHLIHNVITDNKKCHSAIKMSTKQSPTRWVHPIVIPEYACVIFSDVLKDHVLRLGTPIRWFLLKIPVADNDFVVVPIFNPSTDSTSFRCPLSINRLIFLCHSENENVVSSYMKESNTLKASTAIGAAKRNI